uniref:Putative secreted peptide n=1 Tax=Anopheles braziliensis TaxID=58242 RepID=A0A2M3ZU50_9DIPT
MMVFFDGLRLLFVVDSVGCFFVEELLAGSCVPVTGTLPLLPRRSCTGRLVAAGGLVVVDGVLGCSFAVEGAGGGVVLRLVAAVFVGCSVVSIVIRWRCLVAA